MMILFKMMKVVKTKSNVFGDDDEDEEAPGERKPEKKLDLKVEIRISGFFSSYRFNIPYRNVLLIFW